MVDSFTLHSLVRFVYQESCEAENLQLTELAKEDPEVREEINEIREAKSLLPGASFYPRLVTMDKILAYSRKQG